MSVFQFLFRNKDRRNEPSFWFDSSAKLVANRLNDSVYLRYSSEAITAIYLFDLSKMKKFIPSASKP